MQQFFQPAVCQQSRLRAAGFRGFFFLLEFVNANDNTVAFFNVHLPFVSGILNFFLDVAFSDSFRSAAEFINFLNVIPAFSFDLIGQSFYIVGTAQRSMVSARPDS